MTFLSTLAGDIPSVPPIWMMRQAGRYMPAYRQVRQSCSNFIEFCYTPDKASAVTLQPIDAFGFDAAIIFSDILVIPDALGYDVTFVPGTGPIVTPPASFKINEARELPCVETIRTLEYQAKTLAPVYEAIRLTKAALPKNTPLIGFAGAPWTLMTYMIEGGSSRDFAHTIARLYSQPNEFEALLEVVVDAVSKHLIAQADAGVDALQIFDSWASVIPLEAFERICMAPIKAIIDRVKEVHPLIPIIAFPKGIGTRYAEFSRYVGANAVGLDSMVQLDWAKANIDCVMQGNLDPQLLAYRPELALQEAARICRVMEGEPFIFNLGHGILPVTKESTVAAVVDQVKRGLASA